MKSNLTDSSINAISKVISKYVRDDVHNLVANKIRSEFNNTLETIKKLQNCDT
jgi:hypothetical protein